MFHGLDNESQATGRSGSTQHQPAASSTDKRTKEVLHDDINNLFVGFANNDSDTQVNAILSHAANNRRSVIFQSPSDPTDEALNLTALINADPLISFGLVEQHTLSGEYNSPILEKAYLLYRYEKEVTHRRWSVTLFCVVNTLLLGILLVRNNYVEACAWNGDVWSGASLGIYVVFLAACLLALSLINYVLCVLSAKRRTERQETEQAGICKQSVDLAQSPNENEFSSIAMKDDTASQGLNEKNLAVLANNPVTHGHYDHQRQQHAQQEASFDDVSNVTEPQRLLWWENITTKRQAEWYERLSFMAMFVSLPMFELVVEAFSTACYIHHLADDQPTMHCTKAVYPFTLFTHIFGNLLLRPRMKVVFFNTVAAIAMRGFGRLIVHNSPISEVEFIKMYSLMLFMYILITYAHSLVDRQARGVFRAAVLAHRNTLESDSRHQELDGVLRSLLPYHAVDRMKGGRPVLDVAPAATIGMCDLYDFEQWSTKVLPITAVRVISTMVAKFDAKVSSMGLQKIKARGDRYLCGTPLFCASNGGKPTTFAGSSSRKKASRANSRNGSYSGSGSNNQNRSVNSNHNLLLPGFGGGESTITPLIVDLVRFSLYQYDTVERLNKQALEVPLHCRIALHTGEAFGAIVGTNSVSYDVFGPAIEATNMIVQQQRPHSVGVSTTTLDALSAMYPLTLLFENANREIDRSELRVDQPVYTWTLEQGYSSADIASETGSVPGTPSPHLVPTSGELRVSYLAPCQENTRELLATKSIKPTTLVAPTKSIQSTAGVESLPQQLAPLMPPSTAQFRSADENGPATLPSGGGSFANSRANSVVSTAPLNPSTVDVNVFGSAKASLNEGDTEMTRAESDPLATEPLNLDNELATAMQRRELLQDRVVKMRSRKRSNSRRSPNSSSPTNPMEGSLNPLEGNVDGTDTRQDEFDYLFNGPESKSNGLIWPLLLLVPESKKRIAPQKSFKKSSSRAAYGQALHEQLLSETVQQPHETFAMSESWLSNHFLDKRVEHLFNLYTSIDDIRGSLRATSFLFIMLCILFISLLIDLSGEDKETYQAAILGIWLEGLCGLTCVLRMFFLWHFQKTCIKYDEDSEEVVVVKLPNRPRVESISLAFVTWLMFIAMLVTPKNITNSRISYWYILSGVVFAWGFQRYRYLACIPYNFVSYVLYIVVSYHVEAEEKLNQVELIGRIVLSFTALPVFAYFARRREQTLRSRFKERALADAELQSAKDGYALQRGLLNMLFPAQVIPHVLEAIRTDNNTMNIRGGNVVSGGWVQSQPDTVVAQIRLDAFSADVAKYYQSPQEALSYVEAVLSHIDTLVKAANQQQMADTGGWKVLHKINMVGDTLTFAGPLLTQTHVTQRPTVDDVDPEDISRVEAEIEEESKQRRSATQTEQRLDSPTNARLLGSFQPSPMNSPMQLASPTTPTQPQLPSRQEPGVPIAPIRAEDSKLQVEQRLASSCRAVLTVFRYLKQIAVTPTTCNGPNSGSRLVTLNSTGGPMTFVNGFSCDSDVRASVSTMVLGKEPFTNPGISDSSSNQKSEKKQVPLSGFGQVSLRQDSATHGSVNSQGSPTGSPMMYAHILRFSGIAVIGSVYTTVLGKEQPSFDVMGVAVRRAGALLNAAPAGFVGVDEGFHRFALNAAVAEDPKSPSVTHTRVSSISQGKSPLHSQNSQGGGFLRVVASQDAMIPTPVRSDEDETEPSGHPQQPPPPPPGHVSVADGSGVRSQDSSFRENTNMLGTLPPPSPTLRHDSSFELQPTHTRQSSLSRATTAGGTGGGEKAALPLGPPVSWRVRSIGVAKMHPLLTY